MIKKKERYDLNIGISSAILTKEHQTLSHFEEMGTFSSPVCTMLLGRSILKASIENK